ncbi:MAG: Ig domain-containing protein, partial [Dokdonella sp.]
GSFTFTVRATDSMGCFGDQIYTIVINATNCPTITVSPTTLPAANAGIPYSQIITASGGAAPYSFAVTSGSLPATLTLSSTGTLSGTPTTLGSYTFTVTATDAAGCPGSQIYTLTMAANVGAVSAPTLSQWALILLAGLLALVGFLTVRNRGTANSR